MALILNRKYKNTNPIGFYISRTLRLYPAYWIATLIGLIVSFNGIANFYNGLEFSGKVYFLLQNIFILGQDFSYFLCVKTISSTCASPIGMSINPPAWSLAVELGFYLVAPFILKSIRKTFFYVLVGCCYLLFLNIIDFPLKQAAFYTSADLSAFGYYFYPSSIIFFGSGALAYHLGEKSIQLSSTCYLGGIVVLVLLSFTQTTMPFWHLLFISMAIPVLFNYTKKNRLDRIIGELSYPLYILHFPVLLVLKPLVPTFSNFFGFISLGSSVAIVSCGIGLLIYVFIERKIDIFRHSSYFLNKFNSQIKRNYLFETFILTLYFGIWLAISGFIYSWQVLNSKNYEKTPYNLSDGNWSNGIGINFAGFFVKNTQANIRHYHLDGSVRFSDGEIRKIIKVNQVGPYLNVFVDGKPLGGAVGFPNEVEVIK